MIAARSMLPRRGRVVFALVAFMLFVLFTSLRNSSAVSGIAVVRTPFAITAKEGQLNVASFPKALATQLVSVDVAARAELKTRTVSPLGSLLAATTSFPPRARFVADTVSAGVRFFISFGASLVRIVSSRSTRARICFALPPKAIEGKEGWD